jgi:hypothetical protein
VKLHARFVFIFLALLACKETPDTRVQNEKQALASSADNSDEKVDVPNNISGSYLYCQPLLDQPDGQLIHKAGCRLTDTKSGAKVPVERLAKSTQWTFRAGVQSNITADIDIRPPEDVYHAVYTFRTPAGQNPVLGDGSGAIVATLFGVSGATEPLVFQSSIDALVIEVIDSRMLDVFERMIR